MTGSIVVSNDEYGLSLATPLATDAFRGELWLV